MHKSISNAMTSTTINQLKTIIILSLISIELESIEMVRIYNRMMRHEFLGFLKEEKSNLLQNFTEIKTEPMEKRMLQAIQEMKMARR